MIRPESPEHAEADRDRPVHHLLHRREPPDEPSGRPLVQPDRALRGSKRRGSPGRPARPAAAIERHRPVAELAPRLARRDARILEQEARRRLDQDFGFTPRDAGVVGRAGLDLAPDRRIVAGLAELTLLLLLVRVAGTAPAAMPAAQHSRSARENESSLIDALCSCWPSWRCLIWFPSSRGRPWSISRRGTRRLAASLSHGSVSRLPW